MHQHRAPQILIAAAIVDFFIAASSGESLLR
jgi:hypothetical protein